MGITHFTTWYTWGMTKTKKEKLVQLRGREGARRRLKMTAARLGIDVPTLLDALSYLTPARKAFAER